MEGIVLIIGESEGVRGGVQAKAMLRRAEELRTGGIGIGGIPGHSRVVEAGFDFGGLEGRIAKERGRGSPRGGVRFTGGLVEAEDGLHQHHFV